jgi:hypothetical protein
MIKKPLTLHAFTAGCKSLFSCLASRRDSERQWLFFASASSRTRHGFGGDYFRFVSCDVLHDLPLSG